MSPQISTGSNTSSIENRLRTLYESNDDAIFFLDPDGNIIDANRTALAWISLYAPAHIGANIFDIMDSDPFLKKLLPERKSMVQELVSKGKIISFEDRHFDRVWHWFLKPMFSSADTLSEICVTARDVTSQKHAESESRNDQVPA